MGEDGIPASLSAMEENHLTVQRELPESSDIFSWLVQCNKQTHQLSRAEQGECDQRIISTFTPSRNTTFSEGLCRPMKCKVKLSLLFQLASKEGGTQEGPEVFRHWAAFNGLSLEPSGEVKWKARRAFAVGFVFPSRISKTRRKAVFSKARNSMESNCKSDRQSFLHPFYEISAWPVAV